MTKLVRPQKISDQVLAVLEERIATGIYEEGSKLPPERTLAEEFGVSRPSVRVALNILIAKQVLERGRAMAITFPSSRSRIFCKAGRSYSANIPIGNRRIRFQLPR